MKQTPETPSTFWGLILWCKDLDAKKAQRDYKASRQVPGFGFGLTHDFLSWTLNGSELPPIIRQNCALFVLLTAAATADVRLPAVIGSNMVLQQDQPLPIWGWAEPGEQVTVAIGTNKSIAKAGPDGKWKVTLEKMRAGGPLTMTIVGKNSIKLENILVGEVWVCSGQSNMEWSLAASMNPREEIAAANYPKIRLFHVPKVPAGQPAEDVKASWKVCSPKTAPRFSAVGYYYGRALHKELKVPIGLINSSWGGTRIEPWTPPAGFELVPALDDFQQKQVTNGAANYRRAVDGFFRKVSEKIKEHVEPKKKGDELDELIEEEKEETIIVVPIPEDPQLKNALRVKKWMPAAKEAFASDRKLPPLKGGWPRGWPAWPRDPRRSPGNHSALYNGMIAPLIPFSIRGAIWYQGESNRGRGMMYHEMMKGLIFGWRKVWGHGDFPFYFVQLAPFRYGGDPTALPKIWEAQTASLSIPNTGMAVITDIGNVRNIHPKNKQEVGRRLSLWALAKTYGKTGTVYSGPLYRSMNIEGNKIRISFDHVGGGLAARDGARLSHFTIAGNDQKIVPAKAAIEGESIIVWADEIAEPAAVRFGWHQESEPNFINKEGLPASPFRTDDW